MSLSQEDCYLLLYLTSYWIIAQNAIVIMLCSSSKVNKYDLNNKEHTEKLQITAAILVSKDPCTIESNATEIQFMEIVSGTFFKIMIIPIPFSIPFVFNFNIFVTIFTSIRPFSVALQRTNAFN